MADVNELVTLNRFRQIRLVLEGGGNPNYRNEQHETPLMTCVVNILDDDRRAAMMGMLMAFGADVNARNDQGQTVLMYACLYDRIHVLLTLLENEDLNLNAQDNTGNTVLMYACALGRSSMAFALLEELRSDQNRLDIYLTNRSGHTALQIAADQRLAHIVEMFSDIIELDYNRQCAGIGGGAWGGVGANVGGMDVGRMGDGGVGDAVQQYTKTDVGVECARNSYMGSVGDKNDSAQSNPQSKNKKSKPNRRTLTTNHTGIGTTDMQKSSVLEHTEVVENMAKVIIGDEPEREQLVDVAGPYNPYILPTGTTSPIYRDSVVSVTQNDSTETTKNGGNNCNADAGNYNIPDTSNYSDQGCIKKTGDNPVTGSELHKGVHENAPGTEPIDDNGLHENCTDAEKLAWNLANRSRDLVTPRKTIRRASGVKFPTV